MGSDGTGAGVWAKGAATTAGAGDGDKRGVSKEEPFGTVSGCGGGMACLLLSPFLSGDPRGGLELYVPQGP